MRKRHTKNKIIYGIGINDANYPVQPKINGKQVTCPFYNKWLSMLERCSANYYLKYPTYAGVMLCDDWVYFSNFKSWMEQQPWDGMQLDKDILVKGNKIYGPNTCVFIPRQINSLLCFSKYCSNLLGCSLNKTKALLKSGNCYQSTMSTRDGKLWLGVFDSDIKAHKAWQHAKANYIDETIVWWQFNPEINHTFREDVAQALYNRSDNLRYELENNIITVEI